MLRKTSTMDDGDVSSAFTPTVATGTSVAPPPSIQSNNETEDIDEEDVVDDGDIDGESTAPSEVPSAMSDTTILAHGFQGWARVFYQGRNDLKATQIQPILSSTLARHSYVWVEVDPLGKELLIYPEDTSKRLIVDPPVPLKHFYAMKVPGSRTSAALFLKQDDRPFRRYLFRFEFFNDNVLQPPVNVFDLSGSAKAAQKSLKHMGFRKIGKNAKNALKAREEFETTRQQQERRCQEAHNAYLNTLEDMGRDASVAADSFVSAVNSLEVQVVDFTGTAISSSIIGAPKKYPRPSWGPGYENVKSMKPGSSGHDGGSLSSEDSSSDEDDASMYEAGDSDDEKSHVAKTRESVEESFSRMFGQVKKKVNKI